MIVHTPTSRVPNQQIKISTDCLPGLVPARLLSQERAGTQRNSQRTTLLYRRCRESIWATCTTKGAGHARLVPSTGSGQAARKTG